MRQEVSGGHQYFIVRANLVSFLAAAPRLRSLVSANATCANQDYGDVVFSVIPEASVGSVCSDSGMPVSARPEKRVECASGRD